MIALRLIALGQVMGLASLTTINVPASWAIVPIFLFFGGAALVLFGFIVATIELVINVLIRWR